MKFLYLKGMDIFGPFEPEQIAKEDCFSADLLVCPEDSAEQEAAWKPASRYDEFKNYLGKKDADNEGKNKPVNENLVDVSGDFSTIDLNKGQDTSLDLPPLEDTETDEPKNEANSFSFNHVMEDLSSKEGKNDSAKTEEDVKDHTFRSAGKEDNLLEDLPAHSLIGLDAVDKDHPSGKNKSNQEIQDLVPANKKRKTQITNTLRSKKDLLDISNNQIISSSDGRVKKRSSNDIILVLCFVVLTVVAIALCMAFWNRMSGNKNLSGNGILKNESEVRQDQDVDQSSDFGETSVTTEEGEKQIEGVTEDEVTNDSDELAMQTQAVRLEEQVINVVKNTQLANKKRTIGEYLDKIYGAEYQHSWSAKPFTDKVYIVEFFASQIRREPFVYLFRVDLDNKKITGALNNMTLDLLA
ncbi:MAG: hypothetical protein J6S61_00630 [Elusimicrobiaceae bacterium]|nr:hypothetical protein [Elusimicrobiaceae bacterium]